MISRNTYALCCLAISVVALSLSLSGVAKGSCAMQAAGMSLGLIDLFLVFASIPLY